jgi:hypothetical protein
MSVLMVHSKIEADRSADVQAAVTKVIEALDAAQPEGTRYASLLLPDGETFVALLQVDDGVANPLPGLPEYQELLKIVEGSRAAPAIVQHGTVTGSYRLF